jgi:hypothetical protein
MDIKKISNDNLEISNPPNGVCLNYEQFIADCDKLTDSRYNGFRINPKERFNDRIQKVLDEIRLFERTVPSRFCIRLERQHAICNCRIDYTFEVVDKDFLEGNIRSVEIGSKALQACLDSDVDIFIIYTGMNK